MHAKNFLVDDGGNGETVEAVGECFPKFDVVATFAFVVEAVNTVDRCAFVISSKNKEVVWKFDFVGQEEANCFQTLFPTINIVPKKEVIGLRRETPILEKPQ